jgi:3-deoxy-D-manno-octulosonic-acid transferase
MERGKEAGKDLESAGLRVVYRSELSADVRRARNEVDCLLVNTTGELRYFYQPATLIFVGKSLAGEGGQNPIEPAALRKPILFGPNMQNFQSIVEAFLRANAALQVRDEAELEQACRKLLLDATARERLAERALQVVTENKGSMDRTVDMIVEHLKAQDIYVAPSPTS